MVERAAEVAVVVVMGVGAGGIAVATAVVEIATASGAVVAAEGKTSGERPVVSRPPMKAESPNDVLELDAVMPVGCCVCVVPYICCGGCDWGTPVLGPAPGGADVPGAPDIARAEAAPVDDASR